ncbi:hypothetical protein NDU88_004440 [Pleurodeles waltl]|uniref:Uncharacterized protein n=1 Tax=Pleurodeles waltl TaxID=8319 RepID=A0AAV7TSM8_PLEWA|nr:hypothetical protein NDU88_004440 [Pleurodeles waltl]
MSAQCLAQRIHKYFSDGVMRHFGLDLAGRRAYPLQARFHCVLGSDNATWQGSAALPFRWDGSDEWEGLLQPGSLPPAAWEAGVPAPPASWLISEQLGRGFTGFGP